MIYLNTIIAIINKKFANTWEYTEQEYAKEFGKECIRQVLELASEKATVETEIEAGMILSARINKQSILDVDKLVK